jgi:hypothetical protein
VSIDTTIATDSLADAVVAILARKDRPVETSRLLNKLRAVTVGDLNRCLALLEAAGVIRSQQHSRHSLDVSWRMNESK